MSRPSQSEIPMQLELLQRFLAAFEWYATAWRGRLELSSNEQRVLLHLAVEPLSSAELSKRVGITTASMSAIVAGLDARGLIHRVPHPTDRRQIIIYVTKAALTLDAKATDDMTAHLSELSDSLSSADHARVVTFLEGLTAAFIESAVNDDSRPS